MYIFLIAYEIFIILITLSKVFTTPAPHKLAFVINRYGRESLEERAPQRPRVIARKVSDLLETTPQFHTESPLDERKMVNSTTHIIDQESFSAINNRSQSQVERTTVLDRQTSSPALPDQIMQRI